MPRRKLKEGKRIISYFFFEVSIKALIICIFLFISRDQKTVKKWRTAAERKIIYSTSDVHKDLPNHNVQEQVPNDMEDVQINDISSDPNTSIDVSQTELDSIQFHEESLIEEFDQFLHEM